MPDESANIQSKPKVIQGTPTEGMDVDPRYEEINIELTRNWLKEHPGQDIPSFENDDVIRIGPNETHVPTLTSETSRLFKERYPDDAEAYAKKERSRIYSETARDPAIKQAEADIRHTTERDDRLLAVISSASDWRDVWQTAYKEAEIKTWDDFINQYPEKANAYAQRGHKELERALERKKSSNQYNNLETPK